MMYYRISKNEKNLFFGKKNRPGVGSDLNSTIFGKSSLIRSSTCRMPWQFGDPEEMDDANNSLLVPVVKILISS